LDWRATGNTNKVSATNKHLTKDRNVSRRILIIDYITPDKNRDAGSYAMLQEMQLMIDLGAKITFLPENLAHFGELTIKLQKMGVEVLYAPFYMSVGSVIRQRINEFDAVYILRHYVASKYIDLIQSLSKAKVLFHNADLHFLREMRAAMNQANNEQLIQQALNTRSAELEVCKKADAVLCYSAEEHEEIGKYIDIKHKLHITPWVLEPKPTPAPFSGREGIVFLGGFNHPANVEAVYYLCEKIMPALAEVRPELTLYVYGSKMPEEMKALNAPNIKMMGFAQNLYEVFNQHKVFVAPLLSGAGIKGKVLESMAYGLPTVLNDIAIEGTGLIDDVSCLQANSIDEWLKQIVRLLDDEKLWSDIASAANLLVKSQYSKENGLQKMRAIYSALDIEFQHD
jgi:glycosyltransferase involved in cell wall biosynthesis